MEGQKSLLMRSLEYDLMMLEILVLFLMTEHPSSFWLGVKDTAYSEKTNTKRKRMSSKKGGTLALRVIIQSQENENNYFKLLKRRVARPRL